MTDRKVSVTLKAGAGYDAPWVVIGGDTVTEVLAAVQEFTNADGGATVGAADSLWKATYNATFGLGATPVPEAPVLPVQAAPPAPVVTPVTAAVAVPQCAHGPRTHRRSKPGAPKTWQAYFCNTPQGTPGQCDPIFKNADNTQTYPWPVS